VSRLDFAAPYNTHAWPPINKYFTPFVCIEERTVWIGLLSCSVHQPAAVFRIRNSAHVMQKCNIGDDMVVFTYEMYLRQPHNVTAQKFVAQARWSEVCTMLLRFNRIKNRCQKGTSDATTTNLKTDIPDLRYV